MLSAEVLAVVALATSTRFPSEVVPTIDTEEWFCFLLVEWTLVQNEAMAKNGSVDDGGGDVDSIVDDSADEGGNDARTEDDGDILARRCDT